MKTTLKLSLIALAVFIIFGMASCDDKNPSGDPPPPLPLALSGEASIPWVIVKGDTVSVNVSGLNIRKNLKFQWQKADSPSDVFTDIQEASNASYTVPDDMENKYLQVLVTHPKNTSNVMSNVVQVRGTKPVVTKVEINSPPKTVNKGESVIFTATVTGTNLIGDDYSVSWSASGAKKTGTGITADGQLRVSVEETVATLAITATSRLDPQKSATVSVGLIDFTGNIITVSNFSGMKTEITVKVLDGLEADEYVALVAQGSTVNENGTLMVALLSGDYFSRQPWSDKGEYYIKLDDGYDTYVYTNGSALNMTNMDNNAKCNIQDSSTNIDFNKFAKIPLGTGGYAITITGLGKYNNAMAVVDLYAWREDNFSGDDYVDTVANGHAVISGGSVTITLSDYFDWSRLSGWTDGGECFIKLTINDGSGGLMFVYTDGKTLAQLKPGGINFWDEFWEKAPTFEIDSPTFTLGFTKFVDGSGIEYNI